MILKADLHIHTHYSNRSQVLRWGETIGKHLIDSRLTVEEVLIAAKKIGLDVISITDHDEIGGSIKALKLCQKHDLIAVPGIEVTTGEGHLLAYGVTEKIPPKLGVEKTIKYVRDLGGIVVAAHPFNPQGIFFAGRNKKLSGKIELGALEVFSVMRGRCRQSHAYAEKYQIPKLSGSDSKTIFTMGSAYTGIETTKKSTVGVLEAVEAGRTKPVIVKKPPLVKSVLKMIQCNYLS